MKSSQEQPKFEVTMWGTRGSYPNDPNDHLEKMADALNYVPEGMVHLIKNLAAEKIEPHHLYQAFKGTPFWVYGTYGRRTTCLEVRCGKQIFVIDLGTLAVFLWVTSCWAKPLRPAALS